MSMEVAEGDAVVVDDKWQVVGSILGWISVLVLGSDGGRRKQLISKHYILNRIYKNVTPFY